MVDVEDEVPIAAFVDFASRNASWDPTSDGPAERLHELGSREREGIERDQQFR